MAAIEYEGDTYESERSTSVHKCRNCQKRMRENFYTIYRQHVPRTRQVMTRKYVDGAWLFVPTGDVITWTERVGPYKGFLRTWGYSRHSIFCTKTCGYDWAVKIAELTEESE